MDEPNKNDENLQPLPMNTNFQEIFYQSPIGIFFYDKNGRLINANNSALNIARIPKLDDVLGTNIFDNPTLASKKEELSEKRIIRFKDSLDLIKIKEQNIYNPLEMKIIDIDWTVSVINSGYLIQIQDITGNTKNIETLQEDEATYRELFDSLDEAIQICDLVFDDEGHPIDNIVLDVNPAYEKQTGLKRDEVIGRNIKDILPIVEQIWLDRYGEVVSEGKSLHFEEYNAGINRWFDVHATPLEDNKFSAVFTDITERKKTEEALKSNQELFKRTFDSVSFAVSIVRVSDNQIIDINEAYLRMVEYHKEEVVGRTAKELKVFPNYEEREKIARLVHDGSQVRNQEIDVRTKSGKILRALFSVDLINFDNQPHFLGSLINITDRKKAEEALRGSEERLSSVLDNTRDVIVRFNLKTGVYEFISPSAVDLVGYSPDEFINMDAKTALEMVHPDDVTVLQEAIARSIEVDYTEAEYRQRHKNGKYIWVSNNISVQKDNSGKPIYRISNIRDITDRKKAEEKMIITMNELKRSNEELERFAYVSSHDLQEPLRMVTLYSQLLERRYKDSLDSDADDFIEYIVENAKRMKQLIDDLLEYSRVTIQSKELKNVDIEKILDVVLTNLSVPIAENNAKIDHDSLPTVLADKNQMLRVFQNLITNALKFQGDKSPEINISTQKGQTEWIFSISDNGIGIKLEHQKKIFEVFKRLHTREQYPGTGIGLSIVQKIIVHHGGRIWVESELSKGTTFYFTIPFN